MIIKKTLITLSILGLASACGGPGNNAVVPEAQPAGSTSADIGDHVVHFSAQTTDHLPPEVATAYNFVRSKNRAMLTVSIIRKSDNVSIPGDVTVKTVNLTGQLKNVSLRRIDEPGDPAAIYYIGVTAVVNREMLSFDISVKPEGVDQPSQVRFRREFYSD
ncbi:MAG: DUF4426 domain-containing protein [Gammaproteobacteria bacterium]|nr:DUF4426 domain-containing protein [Gammaproteobacteria bacterium]